MNRHLLLGAGLAVVLFGGGALLTSSPQSSDGPLDAGLPSGYGQRLPVGGAASAGHVRFFNGGTSRRQSNGFAFWA